ICTALYELLCSIGVPVRIDGLVKDFTASGELDKANEYRQVWNIVMEAFSQVVEISGDDALGIGRFSEILAAGFEEYSIGLIPPALDQVLAGSVERSKSHEIKALFILGVNEGVFPAAVNEEGILTDAERIRLGSLGIELAKDSKYKLLEERFLVYTSLTTPSRYLRLSFPAADRDGKALRPSRLVSDIKRIFPMIREFSDISGIKTDESELELVAAPGPAFNELTARVRKRFEGYETREIWQDVFNWFQNDGFWKTKCTTMLAGLGYSNQPAQLNRANAFSLYGSPINTSISRLETFASCPFSYYVRYGLKAEERRIFRLDPVDVGTFMHNVLDEFSRLIAAKSMSWRTLEKEWCREQVSSIIDRMLVNTPETVFNSSQRYVWLSGNLKRIVTRAVVTISEHMKRSGFEPVGYEVEFSEFGQYPPIVIELPSGEKLNLTGRIDRIDSMTNEDGTYLRIIDYKSGNRALKLADVYYGLQLQLLTYMDAVLGNKKGKKLIPGGVLYFRLDDPIVKGDRLSSEEDIEKAVMKQLKMKGLLLADVRLVKEMDRQIDGESLIIPARLNKGDILGRSSVATEEQFEVLRSHVRKTLVNIGEEIINGKVGISPFKKRTATACTYCSYSSVCQFDPAMADNNYRFLNDIGDEDVWQLIRRDSGEKGKAEVEA
ncbi:MAG: helicase-exonuclease AddAB subunit AddB, partial [Ruminiclostridium sp.]|nr:helicase-exonuclease AddAB subunit AddB [Ruminiclostridium sp.]